MPQHDRLDLARVLLARAIDDETLVRKVYADTGVADAIVGFPHNRVVEQHSAEDPALRDAQRARLAALRDELVAEGADPSKRLRELQRRADAWPE